MKYISIKLGIILILGFILLLFNNLIIIKFNLNIVDPYLSKASQNLFGDIVFILIVLYSILLSSKRIDTQHSIKIEYVIISTLISILYLYFKSSGRYTYTSLMLSDSFYYTDIIELTMLSVIINICIWHQKRNEPKDNKSPFIIDKPLSNSTISEGDQFGYSKFAKQVALKIQSKLKYNDSGALAIGIVGEWGSGKTSFMNFIKNEIEPESRIIIEFYPWRSSRKNKIIEDFFELLISELNNLDSRLNKNLSSYAKSLTQIHENAITKGLNTISEYIFGSETKNINYSLINEVLTNSRKQIIIFIDDLDRLDKTEVIEVLRLIRNTANFNNIVYVVGYDRSYIEEAVKKINTHKYSSYIEKIFQFELILPYIDPETIRLNLKKLLAENVEAKFLKVFYNVIQLKFGGERYFVNEIIRNQRDVIRFTNNLLFDFEFVKEEVHPKDLFLLQLIKFQFPEIYDSIRINRFLYFTISEEYLDRSILRLRKVGEEDYPDGIINSLKSLNVFDENNKRNTGQTIFERDISLNSKLSTHDRKLIISILEEILSKKNHHEELESQFFNSFIFPNNFNNYFKLALDSLAIPTDEFENARSNDLATYAKKVDNWIHENKYSQLIDKLSNISKFETKIELENHLEILWKLGRKYYVIGHIEQFPIFLIYRAFRSASDHINLYKDTNELKEKVFKLLDAELENAFFAAQLTVQLLVEDKQFILNKEELKDINFKHFQRTCQRPVIDNDFYVMFDHCVVYDPNNTSNYYTINPSAKKLFIQHVKQCISTCQLGVIIKQVNSNPVEFQVDQIQLEKHFGSYTDFIQFLQDAPQIDKISECYKELDQFLKVLNYDKNNNKPIQFKFEYLGLKGT